jgi:glutamate-5-semialdehyde dehydrogenase
MSLYDDIELLCTNARAAATSLALLDTEKKNQLLLAIADKLRENSDIIIEKNAEDLASAEEKGLPKPMIDRLTLTEARIAGICDSLIELTKLDDPVGEGDSWSRPSGIDIKRIRVPLGVVAIIYEARPNVTVDSAALCLKTGNAVILRGGKEAIATNTVLVDLMREAIEDCDVNPHAVGLVKSTDRESANILMSMRGHIDVLIPRGGKGLIKNVTENARVPVIETGAGNCHLYVDETADIDMAINIAINAKCSRPSVCNAIETMLVHASIAPKFLPKFAEKAEKYGVEIRGCAKTRVLVPTSIEATEEDYETEFNDLILAVKVVNTTSEAIDHINKYSTAHSEAIVTESPESSEKFQRRVNSAAVYVNASTRLTDGGEFGFGP